MSLDLEPVVVRLASDLGLASTVIHQRQSNEPQGELPSTWVLLARNPEPLRLLGIQPSTQPSLTSGPGAPLWTDEFSALFPTLRWGTLLGQAGAQVAPSPPLASAGTQRGTAAATIDRCRKLLAEKPDSPVALNNLACLLATAPDAALRNGPEAVRLAEKACAITAFKNPRVMCTLAAAYAEAGRFDEAVATAEKGCSLASDQGDRALLEENRQLLDLFRRRQAFHQPAR
jgi:hypothetical protein